MIVIDKIALIKIENGQILSTRSKGKNKYYIPGGKRENNETDEQTLIREIQEELSVDIIPESIEYRDFQSAIRWRCERNYCKNDMLQSGLYRNAERKQ